MACSDSGRRAIWCQPLYRYPTSPRRRWRADPSGAPLCLQLAFSRQPLPAPPASWRSGLPRPWPALGRDRSPPSSCAGLLRRAAARQNLPQRPPQRPTMRPQWQTNSPGLPDCWPGRAAPWRGQAAAFAGRSPRPPPAAPGCCLRAVPSCGQTPPPQGCLALCPEQSWRSLRRQPQCLALTNRGRCRRRPCLLGRRSRHARRSRRIFLA